MAFLDIICIRACGTYFALVVFHSLVWLQIGYKQYTLYRVNWPSIKPFQFISCDYHWMTNKTLKGSNWKQNSSGSPRTENFMEILDILPCISLQNRKTWTALTSTRLLYSYTKESETTYNTCSGVIFPELLNNFSSLLLHQQFRFIPIVLLTISVPYERARAAEMTWGRNHERSQTQKGTHLLIWLPSDSVIMSRWNCILKQYCKKKDF